MAKIMQMLQLIKIHKTKRKSQQRNHSRCCTVFLNKSFFLFIALFCTFFFFANSLFSFSLFLLLLLFIFFVFRCTKIASVYCQQKNNIFLSASNILFRCLVSCLFSFYVSLFLSHTADIRHIRRFVRWTFGSLFVFIFQTKSTRLIVL